MADKSADSTEVRAESKVVPSNLTEDEVASCGLSLLLFLLSRAP